MNRGKRSSFLATADAAADYIIQAACAEDRTAAAELGASLARKAILAGRDPTKFLRPFLGQPNAKRKRDNTQALPFSEGDVAAASAPSGPGQGKILAMVHPEGGWTARRPSHRWPFAFLGERLELDPSLSSKISLAELWRAYISWLGADRRHLAGSDTVLSAALNAWVRPQLDRATLRQLATMKGRESARGLLCFRATSGVRRARHYVGIRLKGG